MNNMNGLVLPEEVDKLTMPQKILAFGGLGIAAYFIVPILLTLMVNIYILLAMIIPLGIVVYNWQVVWYLFTMMSDKLSSWAIGLDVLGAMDRYLLWYKEQYQILLSGKAELETTVNSTREEINLRNKSYTENMNKADYAAKHNMDADADIYLSNAQIDKELVADLLPLVNEGEEQVKYMAELAEAVKGNEKKLEYNILAQKSKFKMLKSMRKGLGAAAQTVGGLNSNEVWRKTNEQLVKQMNKMTNDINRYKDVVQPAIQEARFNKQLRQTEGRKLLEEFRATARQLTAVPEKELVTR